jgi:hypothetical protein
MMFVDTGYFFAITNPRDVLYPRRSLGQRWIVDGS